MMALFRAGEEDDTKVNNNALIEAKRQQQAVKFSDPKLMTPDEYKKVKPVTNNEPKTR